MPERDEKILYPGRYLSLHLRDDWEFATRRPRASGAVVVLATTEKNELLLVDQYRRPMAARCIELCAGLVGDEPGKEDESLAETARRELLEETGHRAAEMRFLFTSPSVPGMCDEIFHVFHATGLEKVEAGGGVAGENIKVHTVPLDELWAFLKKAEAEGAYLDHKIFSALWAAGFQGRQFP